MWLLLEIFDKAASTELTAGEDGDPAERRRITEMPEFKNLLEGQAEVHSGDAVFYRLLFAPWCSLDTPRKHRVNEQAS